MFRCGLRPGSGSRELMLRHRRSTIAHACRALCKGARIAERPSTFTYWRLLPLLIPLQCFVSGLSGTRPAFRPFAASGSRQLHSLPADPRTFRMSKTLWYGAQCSANRVPSLLDLDCDSRGCMLLQEEALEGVNYIRQSAHQVTCSALVY